VVWDRRVAPLVIGRLGIPGVGSPQDCYFPVSDGSCFHGCQKRSDAPDLSGWSLLCWALVFSDCLPYFQYLTHDWCFLDSYDKSLKQKQLYSHYISWTMLWGQLLASTTQHVVKKLTDYICRTMTVNIWPESNKLIAKNACGNMLTLHWGNGWPFKWSALGFVVRSMSPVGCTITTLNQSLKSFDRWAITSDKASSLRGLSSRSKRPANISHMNKQWLISWEFYNFEVITVQLPHLSKDGIPNVRFEVWKEWENVCACARARVCGAHATHVRVCHLKSWTGRLPGRLPGC